MCAGKWDWGEENLCWGDLKGKEIFTRRRIKREKELWCKGKGFVPEDGIGGVKFVLGEG